MPSLLAALGGHVLGLYLQRSSIKCISWTLTGHGCWSLDISPLKEVRHWSCPCQLSYRGRWTSDRQGSAGGSERSNLVLWDVRVQWRGVWDSIALVSALITCRNATAAKRAAVMTEAAVNVQASRVERPLSSHGCCLEAWLHYFFCVFQNLLR